MFKRRGLRLVMFCIFLIVGWSFVQLQAQSPLIPLSTAESSVSDSANPSLDGSATPEALGNYLLASYRIAYLVAEGAVPPDHITSPEYLTADFRPVIAYNWETFIAEETNQPFDVVIIHKSALPFVDYEWARSAYRHGVVFGLINIFYPELSSLMGQNCGTPSEPFYEDNFWVTYYLKIGASLQSDADKLVETVMNCNTIDEANGLSDGAYMGRGMGMDSFDGDYGYRLFTGSLMSKLYAIEQIEALSNSEIVAPTQEVNR